MVNPRPADEQLYDATRAEQALRRAERTQPVKSAFELPWGGRLAGGRTRLTGRSWSGAGRIRTVEVSTDGGASWHRVPPPAGDDGRVWQRWELDSSPPGPGSYELLARATPVAPGRPQPDTVPFNDNGYQFWAVARHPVTVG